MAAEMKRTMNDLYEAERKDDTPTPLEQAAAENDGFEEAEPADAEADDEEYIGGHILWQPQKRTPNWPPMRTSP